MPYRQCEYKEEINGYIMPTFILILRTYAAVIDTALNRSIPAVRSQIVLQTVVVKTCDNSNWKAVMQPDPVNKYLCHERISLETMRTFVFSDEKYATKANSYAENCVKINSTRY